jgi:hypothetical protein
MTATPDTNQAKQPKRTDARRMRSETKLAARRLEAQTPSERMHVEWDALRCWIKALPTEVERDAIRERVVAALRHFR